MQKEKLDYITKIQWTSEAVKILAKKGLEQERDKRNTCIYLNNKKVLWLHLDVSYNI